MEVSVFQGMSMNARFTGTGSLCRECGHHMKETEIAAQGEYLYAWYECTGCREQWLGKRHVQNPGHLPGLTGSAVSARGMLCHRNVSEPVFGTALHEG